MYYADPDGKQMEFQVECYGPRDEATAYMHGPHFSANPIGVEYGPDDWLARLRPGVPPSDFLVRWTDEPLCPFEARLRIDGIVRISVAPD
jgi:hypothetical protein